MKPLAANIIVQHPDGRTMLQFRDGKPISLPLTWCFFGGGREGDESMAECAARELNEEITINAKPEDMEFVAEYDGVKHYVHLYRYKKTMDWGQFKLGEGAATGFFTRDEMLRLNMSPDNKAMVEMYPEVFA